MSFFDTLRKAVRPKGEADKPVVSTQPEKSNETALTKPPPTTPASPPAAPRVNAPAAAQPVAAEVKSADRSAPAPQLAARPALAPRRLLFVGTDAAWFHRVEGQMVELQPDWLCWRTDDVSEAEMLLSSASFDSLVLDSQTSQATNLLDGPDKKVGKAICIVRCDLSDRQSVAQWNRLGATPVSADGEATALVASLRRTERLREWMAIPALMKLLPQIRKLPAKPKLYTQVTEELESPSGSMAVVARLISQDPLMSAKMLQMANSAFFGLMHEVTDTADAVMMLGTERIRSLVLLAGVFSQYDSVKCHGFSLELIWDHSLWVGLLSRTIAQGETRNVKTADMAFTAGLFHDIGKLVLAGNLPEMFEAVRRMQKEKNMSQLAAEMAVLGTTHAELGACLLATWGLPLPILEAIAWHHEPERSDDRGFSLLAGVHAANVFAQENGHSGNGEGPRESINIEFLVRSGLGDCRSRWQGFCGIGTKRGAATVGEKS